MGPKDLIITPFYLILFTLIAYVVRPYVTTSATRKYFLPALWLRFMGAIALGLLYQFWYGGGDTFNYFSHGSRWIYEAFWVDAKLGIKMLFDSGRNFQDSDIFRFSQHIWYYRDPSSYFIVRIAALFDLLTFHTYSSTALFFAVFTFSGVWALFSVVSTKYEFGGRWLANVLLFVPSVVFWGSGVLKDSITLGALSWLTWAMIHLIDFGNRKSIFWLVAAVAAWMILSIKIYILICYIPTLFVWIYWKQVLEIRSHIKRLLIAPALLVFFGILGFGAMNQVASFSEKYSVDAIAERAAITAYDIRYGWGARTKGDGGYDIGLPDGTWQSMIRLMPAAINVSLFRPFLWEVRNPLMLLAALESTIILFFTIMQLIYRKGIFNVFRDPFLVFCLIFTLLFAFAVGVSTFNFGTLIRYKIPMMVFYLIILSVSSKKKEQGKVSGQDIGYN